MQNQSIPADSSQSEDAKINQCVWVQICASIITNHDYWTMLTCEAIKSHGVHNGAGYCGISIRFYWTYKVFHNRAVARRH